jgi:ribonuclease HII
MSQFQMQTGKEAKTLIVGLDEAGRGPLVGPVYAGAVVLPYDFPIGCLNDSKKLSRKKRIVAEAIIKEKALVWATAFATHEEIDRLNILQASMLAMERAFMKVNRQLEEKGLHAGLALVDGNRCPDLPVETKAFVKGDATYPPIMAASILAKQARDRIMVLCAEKWPGYGLEKHMGYPTEAHRKAIALLGPLPIQRKSFRTVPPKSEAQGKLFSDI